MKRRVSAALSLLLTAAVLAACGNPQVFSEEETLSARHQRKQNSAYTFNYADGAREAPKAYSAYAGSVTDFALRQLRFRARQDSAGFVFSPMAASLQAALLANAASKDTRQEILRALGAGTLTAEDVNVCSSYCKSRLETVGKADDSEKNAAGITLDGALLLDKTVDVRSAFLQTNADFYGCDIFRYAYDGEYAAQKLNHYWQAYTDDCGIAPNGALNAVYACSVSDTWLEASAEAAEGAFRGTDKTERLPYFTSNAKLLHSGKATGVLKYTAETPLKLLVALPDDGAAFDSWVQGFDAAALNALLGSMDVTKTAAVNLPAFSVPGSKKAVAVNDRLANSGLFSLSGGKASFTALSYTEAAAMGSFYELSADFTLNRSGVNTTAAAPAAAVADGESLTVDRPFLFFLLDNESNIPVLAGCYR